MKKFVKALFLGLLLMGSAAVMAQSLSVNQSDYTQSAYSFKAPQLVVQPQQAEGATFAFVTFEGAAPSTQLGRPNLPIITEMIEIPLCSKVNVTVSNVQTKDLEPLKYPMMPVQPAPSKADKGPLPFVIDSAFYATDAFTDQPAAWVQVMGVARDRNMALLRVSPLSYNPVTGGLRLITAMDITLTFEGADVAATQQMHRRYYSPDYSLGHSLLSSMPSEKSVSQAAPLHYLIVAHSSFRGQLDQFINWKKRQGFKVTVGYTDDAAVGTTSNTVAAYAKSFYDNASDTLPAPTYLLIVGDHQQIPAFSSRVTSPSSNHVTDLYFATWTSGDIVPDCYYGRFSAQTVAQLTPQIEKTIFYEGYNFTNDSYLGKGMLIAGVDGGWEGDNAYRYADPAMDYVAKYYINTANGYTDIKYYKNNTSFAPAGVTVTGSSQTTASANAIKGYLNEGYGWVNYSAHGNDDCWGQPSFNTTDVAAMTNNGKPSIMIGNCCLSGRFNTEYGDCFGEALLHKGDNAGAVAYFGCTNSSYWPPDFCWEVGYRSSISNAMDATYDALNLGMYDRLFHTHGESYGARHVTAGSMITAGNMAVETYGSYVDYYWEIYELFGDPSLMPWLAPAQQMSIAPSTVIVSTDRTYGVTAVPYAYVALTTADDHAFVAAAYADATGMATLTLPESLVPGELELAIWAQNYVPFFQTVSVIVPDGPYVMVTDIVPTNGKLRPGEVATFDVSIANVGNANPTWNTIDFSTPSDNVSVLRSQASFSECHPGDTVTISGICPVYISEDLEDGAPVRIDMSVNFGGDIPSVKSRLFTVSASRLEASDAVVTPGLAANTSSDISCSVVNNGSDSSEAVLLTLVNGYGLLSAEATDVLVRPLAPGESVDLNFNVTMGPDAPTASIPFYLYATTDRGTTLVREFSFRSGANFTEGFESGNLNSYSWSNNANPWEITSSESHSGTYCARSKTGLAHQAESKLSLTWTSAVDDSIRFSYKVSSERRWDIFSFSIDGSVVLEGSGQQDWTDVAYPVPAGTHVFAFSYAKDYSASYGSDCAWIDDITLPFNGDRCAFTIDTVCQGSDYTFYSQQINTNHTGMVSCVDSSTSIRQYLSLKVVPQPEVAIQSTNFGKCTLLEASGADTYEWSTGETGYYIVVCPEGEIAQVTVTGYRGNCSATASTSVSDIQDVTVQPAVKLYPNPARNSVTVAATGIRSVELVSLMGQTLQRKQVGADCITLELQGLPSGVYFVKIETNESVVVKKLIRK